MSYLLRSAAIAIAMAALVRVDPSGAAEIKVLSAGAMKEVMVDLGHEFEKATGHKLAAEFDTVGALAKRIQGGTTPDVAVMTPAAIDELIKQGKFAPGSRVDLGRVKIGVAIRDGAAKPDLSSVEAFKRALLAARSIVYADPVAGATSGRHFAGVLERLGIGEAMKPKTKLLPGGYVVELVAKGEAELGIHQISEILPVKGVVLAGALPDELQLVSVYAVALGAGATDSAAAQALIKFLSAPAAAPVYRSKGMEPAGS
jgi:molybdate transport system substrate-binding protein